MMACTGRRTALVGTAVLALAIALVPARAQMLVYDPSNHAQNVLQAARALQQINNQITSLQNQTQMLLNQAKNLASLPYSSLQAIEQSLARTQQLLKQAQRLAYDVNQIDQTFQRLYPQSYAGSTSSQQLVSDAQARWQNALAGYQDALRVQAGVVQALDTTRSETSALVSSSQSAEGILQATQAGNQLIALQTRQLADLTALIAAQSRAQSLDGARATANQEQARRSAQSVPRQWPGLPAADRPDVSPVSADMNSLGRIIAYVALVGALIATAITFERPAISCSQSPWAFSCDQARSMPNSRVARPSAPKRQRMPAARRPGRPTANAFSSPGSSTRTG